MTKIDAELQKTTRGVFGGNSRVDVSLVPDEQLCYQDMVSALEKIRGAQEGGEQG